MINYHYWSEEQCQDYVDGDQDPEQFEISVDARAELVKRIHFLLAFGLTVLRPGLLQLLLFEKSGGVLHGVGPQVALTVSLDHVVQNLVLALQVLFETGRQIVLYRAFLIRLLGFREECILARVHRVLGCLDLRILRDLRFTGHLEASQAA